MNIRRVKQEDGQLLREIAIRMYSDSPDAFSETLQEAKQRTVEQWESRAKWLAESPDVMGLIAFDNDWPCGFVMGLIGRFINGSMDWDCRDRVTIARTWVDPNEAAKSLYKHLGFTDTGHREPLVSNPQLQIHFLEIEL